MGRSLTNNLALAYAIESSAGTLPGSPTWKSVEPNDVTKLGAEVKKVARSPISKNIQRRKGAVVDLDSGFEFVADVTHEHINDFVEGFLWSVAKGQVVLSGGVNTTSYLRPTAVTTTAYTVPTMNAALAQNRLIYARGFSNSANNGLKVVDAAGTTTSIPVTGGGMVAESPTSTQNATVEVCGVQGATGDITINASGNIVSTALNWTTLAPGLTVGQWIKIGGTAAANQFANTVNNGYARVTAISATTLTLDKRNATFVADTGVGKTIHVYFGRFVRNVAVDSADYLERYYQFEAAFENLNSSPGVDEYMYAKGNLANEWSLNLPLADKATMTCSFIGLDTLPPSTTRATNAASPIIPVQTILLNDVGDIARLRVVGLDESGVSTDFKNVQLMIKNNVNPSKVLGTLGAKYMNRGNFEVDITSDLIFTSSLIATAVRDNRSLTFDLIHRNDDGAVVFDVPEVTLGDGTLDFPQNEEIRIKIAQAAHQSTTFGYTLGVSIFPFAPALS
jgi:hypothetical protein